MKAVISLCLLSLLTEGYSQHVCATIWRSINMYNYCPMVMLKMPDWTKRFPECCCHPIREGVMLPRNHPYLYNKECVKFGGRTLHLGPSPTPPTPPPTPPSTTTTTTTTTTLKPYAYCATNVTSSGDIYVHPECCDHEETVAKYAGTCSELTNEGYCCITTITIDNLWHCPSRVTSIDQLKNDPTCCMHPLVRMIPGVPEQCCNDYEVCLRKKRTVAGCSMNCRDINYCKMKMLTTPNWTEEGKYPECCCHPFRKTRMLKRKHKYLYNDECEALGAPRVV